jgi:predicted CopG family antitoxin
MSDLNLDSSLDSLLAHPVYDNLKDFDDNRYKKRLFSLLSQRDRNSINSLYHKTILEYLGKDYEKLKEKANSFSIFLKQLNGEKKYKNIQLQYCGYDEMKVIKRIKKGKIVGRFTYKLSSQQYQVFNSYQIELCDFADGRTLYLDFFVNDKVHIDIEDDFEISIYNSHRDWHIHIIFKSWDIVDKYEKVLTEFKLEKGNYDSMDILLKEVYDKFSSN